MHIATLARAAWPFRGVGRATAFLAAGVVVQFAALLVLSAPWVLFVPISTWAVLLAFLAPLGVLVLAGPTLTEVQRTRLWDRLAVALPRPPDAPRRPKLRQIGGWLASRTGRRQLWYHLLIGPLFGFASVLLFTAWTAAVGAASALAWVWLVPPEHRVYHHGYTTFAALLSLAGVALLYVLSWLSRALARGDASAATSLLGPDPAELRRRVADLTESRAAVLDAADAERRRIERDLHDGAQQRLVALAVNLGLARATMTDLPADARAVIDQAHREAKDAITELNDLVRGLHPAVLEDRGLDAALSGLAARAPVPVRLHVDLPIRPTPTVEAVAYFVVSEALTNVVKHARASGAQVRVRSDERSLLIDVDDDGIGGADTGGGSGLSGLAKRVASVDGRLSIDSPPGGPTTITVELPCAR